MPGIWFVYNGWCVHSKGVRSYRITSGAYQYGRTRPGVGDRLLDTWDVHGVLEDFCKAMEMTLPTGDDVYVTAKGQFDWIKEELSIPEVS